MSQVRTILGDIPPQDLGVCYAHEHIVIDTSYATDRYPDFLLNDREKLLAELRDLKAAGVDAVIDSMPGGCGRNAQLQAKLSKAAGIHIVVPTGVHLAQYYPSNHWSHDWSTNQFARLFVDEIETGLEGSSLRAGLIKVATEDKIYLREERVIEGAGQAHVETGVPILTHTEQGALGLEQVERFLSYGVDLSKVTLSHLDRKPDVGYHREVLSTGVNLEYDSAFRWKTEGNPTLDLMVRLFPEYPDQLMLGMDAARNSYWKSYGGAPGLTFLVDRFAPQLIEAGLRQEDLDRIFVSTPRKAYAFKSSLSKSKS